MYVERHVVEVTTDASGGAIAYTPNVTGEISSIVYIKTDFADGVDFAITLEATGQSLWTGTDVNASASANPHGPAHDLAGAESEYASGYPVSAPIRCANDRVKIVVTDGGAAKTGTFHIVIA